MNINDDPTLKCAYEALTSIVMGYCAAFIAAFEAGNSKKGLRLCEQLHRIIRKHIRIHHSLRAMALCEALYKSADMRIRVRNDLGGKPAMMRWKVRKRFSGRSTKDLDASTPQFLLDRIERKRELAGLNPRERKNKWKTPTDRYGHFRLARIPTGSMAKGTVTTRCVSVSRDTSINFQPIEVEANDLMTTLPYVRGYDTPPQAGTPSAGYGEPVDRWPR